MSSNRHDTDDDLEGPFAVWPKDGSDVDARPYRAATARQAAERRARDDYALVGVDRDWPIAYCARDGLTGKIWTVLVGVVAQPSFVALDAYEVEMPPTVHVLWGGQALCEDLRLRGVPRDWPSGQSWISLRDVADGVGIASDDPRACCEVCWAKAPRIIAGLKQIGADR